MKSFDKVMKPFVKYQAKIIKSIQKKYPEAMISMQDMVNWYCRDWSSKQVIEFLRSEHENNKIIR